MGLLRRPLDKRHQRCHRVRPGRGLHVGAVHRRGVDVVVVAAAVAALDVLDPAEGEPLSRKEKELQDLSRTIYQERLDAGVAREQARKDLPLSTYTEAYWKIDLHNLLLFLSLRMDDHAQLEIREFAEAVLHFFDLAFPHISMAFHDYRLGAVTFSQMEIFALRGWLVLAEPPDKEALAVDGLEGREAQEFLDKLEAIRGA